MRWRNPNFSDRRARNDDRKSPADLVAAAAPRYPWDRVCRMRSERCSLSARKPTTLYNTRHRSRARTLADALARIGVRIAKRGACGGVERCRDCRLYVDHPPLAGVSLCLLT